jgi:hypothetical protein
MEVTKKGAREAGAEARAQPEIAPTVLDELMTRKAATDQFAVWVGARIVRRGPEALKTRKNCFQ